MINHKTDFKYFRDLYLNLLLHAVRNKYLAIGGEIAYTIYTLH
jgi:hypothetical protein